MLALQPPSASTLKVYLLYDEWVGVTAHTTEVQAVIRNCVELINRVISVQKCDKLDREPLLNANSLKTVLDSRQRKLKPRPLSYPPVRRRIEQVAQQASRARGRKSNRVQSDAPAQSPIKGQTISYSSGLPRHPRTSIDFRVLWRRRPLRRVRFKQSRL